MNTGGISKNLGHNCRDAITTDNTSTITCGGHKCCTGNSKSGTVRSQSTRNGQCLHRSFRKCGIKGQGWYRPNCSGTSSSTTTNGLGDTTCGHYSNSTLNGGEGTIQVDGGNEGVVPSTPASFGKSLEGGLVAHNFTGNSNSSVSVSNSTTDKINIVNSKHGDCTTLSTNNRNCLKLMTRYVLNHEA